jgi:hypothetical protein
MDLRNHPNLGPLVETQAGVARLSQLAGELSYGQVRAQIASRRWRRAGRGVIVTSNADLTPRQERWVALCQAPLGSALSGPTAAALDGLPVDESEPVHVTIPCGERRPLGCTAEVHWSRFLGIDDVHPTFSPRRTRLPRSVVDWAAWQPLEAERTVRTIVLGAVQKRLTTPELLRLHLARRGHCRHHALIGESINDAEGGIASVPELEFSQLVGGIGLPKPTRQAVRHRPSGRAYLDVDWEEYGYSAEIEGAQHFEAAHRDGDLARLNDLVIAGERVLQFSSFAVRRRSEKVASVLVRALRSAGWTGSAAA